MARRKARRKNGRQDHPSGVSEIFHSKMSREEDPASKRADRLVEWFGTIPFFLMNLAFFGAWIAVNVGAVPDVKPFDPYPFVMLTTIVSLEAIFLSIIVLIAQNKAAKLADLREQIDLQVNVQAEREVTKILHILDRIQHKLGMRDEHDEELASMKKMLDLEQLERQVLEDMAKDHMSG